MLPIQAWVFQLKLRIAFHGLDILPTVICIVSGCSLVHDDTIMFVEWPSCGGTTSLLEFVLFMQKDVPV